MAKAGRCPRCGWKMWYSAKHKRSRCAWCGFIIRWNSVISQ